MSAYLMRLMHTNAGTSHSALLRHINTGRFSVKVNENLGSHSNK